MDLTGYLDGTGAAGGCHRTLGVCVDSSWFRLPEEGDGRFAIRLQMPAPGASLLVSGGTAGWPGEPFVLGPWSDTEAFAWRGADRPDLRRTRRRPPRSRRAFRFRDAGGPGQNRTATAEGEGFTDPWAHHLPNRPTVVEMRGLEPLASAMRTRRSPS